MSKIFTLVLLMTIVSLGPLTNQSVKAQTCPVTAPSFIGTQSLSEIENGTAISRTGTHLPGEEIRIGYTASGAINVASNAGDWAVRINGDSTTDRQLRDSTVAPVTERIWSANIGSYNDTGSYSVELIYSSSGSVCSTSSFRIGSGTGTGEAPDLGTIAVPNAFPTNPSDIIASAVTVLLGFAGLIFFIVLLIGGLRYLTAGGDEKATMAARQTLTNAFIGLVIVVASFLIAQIMFAVFGLDALVNVI